MQLALALLALAGCALAFPQQLVEVHPTFSRSGIVDPAGQYSYSILTSDGASIQDFGSLKRTLDGLDNVLVRQGTYSYTSPEGRPVSVSYIADEGGYRATGTDVHGAGQL